MKNWLLWALIFLLSLQAGAKWQFTFSPKQENMPQFGLIGYDWEVEPFVISLQAGIGFKGEAMSWERKDYFDNENDSFFSALHCSILPTVSFRLEKLSPQKVTPYVQIRYSQAILYGDSTLDLPWLPIPERDDLEDCEYKEIWEFWRFGSGVRLKITEHLSFLADYGLEATYLKADEYQYENHNLGFEEHILRLWPNTYAGLSIVWYW